MKRYIALLVIFALSISLVFAEIKPLYVNELVDIAKQNDLQMNINALEIQKLQLLLKDAKEEAQKYTYEGDNKEEEYRLFKLNKMEPAIAENNLKHEEYNQYLYDQTLRIKVENAVAEVWLAQLTRKNQLTKIEHLKNELSALKTKYKLGLIIKLDVQQKQSDISDAQTKLLDIENKIKNATLQLKKVIGVGYNDPIAIEYVVKALPEYGELPAELLESYANNQLEVIKAKDEFSIKQSIYDFVKENFSESLRTYKEAYLDYFIAKNKYESIYKNAVADVTKDYQLLKSSYKSYQVAEEYFKIAQEENKNAELKYNKGLASKLELKSAQLESAQKEYEKMVAANTYNNALRTFNLKIENPRIEEQKNVEQEPKQNTDNQPSVKQ